MKLLLPFIIFFILAACHSKPIKTDVNKDPIKENKNQSTKRGIPFFKGSFEEALAEAKKANKLMFVDVYTEWCAPCIKMAKTVFLQKDVGELFSQHFVSYKLDAEDDEMNGPEIAEKYQVNSFPTYLFIDGTGNLTAKETGAMSADAFMFMAAKHAGIEYDACKAYKQGDKSIRAFLDCHIKNLLDANQSYRETQDISVLMKVDQDYNQYFNSLSNEELLSEEGFRLISNAFDLARGKKPADFLIDNYQTFVNFVEPNLLASLVVEANNRGITNMSFSNPKKAEIWVEDIKGKLAEAYKTAEPDNHLAYESGKLKLNELLKLKEKDWIGMIELHKDYINLLNSEKEKIEHMMVLCHTLIIYGCNDKKALDIVMAYPKQAWEEKQTFDAALAYAYLLAKTKQTEKANTIFQEAEAIMNKELDTAKKEKMQQQLQQVSL